MWGQGRSALCIPRFPIQSICLAIHYLSVGIPLTTRVVDPLSLATVADSIMVEVEDLNHYGVGLFDFCVGNIEFLARLTARSKWVGQGRSALCIPHLLNSASGIFRILKIALDVCKDNYLFQIIFICHFLFRSLLKGLEYEYYFKNFSTSS